MAGSKGQKALILAITFLFWTSVYVCIPYQTPFLSGLGVSAAFIGVVVGAYGASQMLLRIPVGMIADRRPRHKLFIIVGICCIFAASLLRAVAPSGVGFLIGGFFAGVAASTWLCYTVSYAGFFKPEEVSKGLSVIIGVNNGGICAGFALGMFFYDTIGMINMCYISMGVAVVALILACFLKPQQQSAERAKVSVRELARVCVRPRILSFGLLAFVSAGILAATVSSFTTQITKDLGGTGLLIGLASLTSLLAAVISSLVGSTKFAQKAGGKVWIPVIFVCVCAYCILLPNVTQLAWVYPLQILAGLGQGMQMAFMNSEALVGVPTEMRSTAMGTYQALYAAGMMVFPAVSGAIIGASGMRMGYYVMAAAALVAAAATLVIYAVIGKKERAAVNV